MNHISVYASPIIFLMTVIACSSKIPPQSLTGTRLTVSKQKIIEYARIKNELPQTLADLPILTGHDDKIQDGWGFPIKYSFDSAGVVTLGSNGNDGVPGGGDLGCDIVGKFETKDGSGKWKIEPHDWLIDPFTSWKNCVEKSKENN